MGKGGGLVMKYGALKAGVDMLFSLTRDAKILSIQP